MAQYSDGSIQSANLPTARNTSANKDFRMYRAMILDYIYADDAQKNFTSKSKNPEVLYKVVILGGFKSGQTVSGVRLSRSLGGQFNFQSHRLRKSSKKLADPLSEHDGDIVYIQFNQGEEGYPVITAFGVSLQDKDSQIKKEDGPTWQWQYNGVHQKVDKDGNFIQTIKGGKYDQEKDDFTPGTEGLIVSTFNPKDETWTRTYKSGLKVLEDGKNQKMEIDASNGKTKVTVDGKSNKISLTAGSTLVEIDGGSGAIKLSGKSVDLGASVSDFVTMFTELANAFNSHTHMYNPGPGAPAPSQPPMAPLLETCGSQTVKVQP